MTGGEFLHREGGPGPENIHRSVDSLGIKERPGNPRWPVIEWRLSIMTSAEDGIACGIASPAHLRKDRFEPLRIARKPIIRLLRSAQPLQNSFALLLWTKCQIRSPDAGEQPADMLTDTIPVPRMNKKWTVRLVGFAPFHVVASGNHQVGGPADLLAEAIEHGCCRLGHAIIAVAFAPHAHESTDSVMSVDQPS